MCNVEPTSVVILLKQRTLRASPITPARSFFLARLWELYAMLLRVGDYQRTQTSHALIVDSKLATSVMVVFRLIMIIAMLKRGCQQTIWTPEHLELHCVVIVRQCTASVGSVVELEAVLRLPRKIIGQVCLHTFQDRLPPNHQQLQRHQITAQYEHQISSVQVTSQANP